MKLTSEHFKLHLALELQKRGHTLEDFEAALASFDQPGGPVKLATLLMEPIEKQALGSGDFIPTPMGILRATAGAAALGSRTAAGAGALGAIPIFSAQKTLDREDASIDEKTMELAEIKAAIARLQQEYGIKAHTLSAAPNENAQSTPA